MLFPFGVHMKQE